MIMMKTLNEDENTARNLIKRAQIYSGTGCDTNIFSLVSKLKTHINKLLLRISYFDFYINIRCLARNKITSHCLLAFELCKIRHSCMLLAEIYAQRRFPINRLRE